MNRAWDALIYPICRIVKPKTIVEIGSEFGLNTAKLVDFAVELGTTVHAIDPFPMFDVDGWRARFGDTFVFHRTLSLRALPNISGIDLAIVDGDHNWYTVYNELKLIGIQSAGGRFPMVLLHDIGWPYGRRDLYYDPSTVPTEFVKPWARLGMRPDQAQLHNVGGYNSGLCNALEEGGERNGVLTAVTDFIQESKEKLRFVTLPILHGIGILCSENLVSECDELANFLAGLQLSPAMAGLVGELERSRVDSAIQYFDVTNELTYTQGVYQKLSSEFEERTAWAQSLDRQLSELKLVFSRLPSETNSSLSAAETLAAELFELDGRYRVLQAESNRLSTDLAKSRTEATHVKSINSSLAAELRTKRSELERLEDWVLANTQEGGVMRLDPTPLEDGESELPVPGLDRGIAAGVDFDPAGVELPTTITGGLPAAAPSTPTVFAVAGQLSGKVYRSRHRFKSWAKPVAQLLYRTPFLGIRLRNYVTWRQICLPTSLTPEVSVIIPVHNNCAFTTQCLHSIAMVGSSLAFEVIVVDDNSTDFTRSMLRCVKGVRVVRAKVNRGFIGSCNAGAEVALGNLLVFLNNDTVVKPGWLESLKQTFDQHGDAGLVGAKLVYPDLRLQEAGGIIWSDGSGWNYGRYDDPGRPQYNYLREVDYCSGACVAIPRELFAELGSFDSHFSPAYYEDVDLAFKVRRLGKRVYYQPRCEVVHYEGVSSGTDLDSGVKRYQVVNQQKFKKRWSAELTSQLEVGTTPALARERGFKRRALVVDACTLTPDADAGSLRMLNLIQVLQSLSYKVTFVPHNLLYIDRYTAELQALGIEVLHAPEVTSLAEHLMEFGDYYDCVMLSRADVAEANIDQVISYCPRALIVFDTVDLHYLREERLAELENHPVLRIRARRRKRQELLMMSKADVTLVVSSVEKELLAKETSAHVEVVSLIHDVPGNSRSFDERNGVLFVAGFNHHPNVDAALFFVRQVMPRVLTVIPDLVLNVVGANPPVEVRRLASHNVCVTGFVPDLVPYLQQSRVSVAPLRYGAGVKGKIVSSMANGLPVVCTSLAAEGMYITHGDNGLVADSADGLAAEIIRVYNDRMLWQKLSRAGIENVRDHFSFDVAKSELGRILLEDSKSDRAMNSAA